MSLRNSAKVVQHSCSIWEKDWQHLVARWCQCTGHSSWQHMCRAGLGQNAGKWEHMCREVAFTSWLYSQIQNPNLSTLNPGKLFPSSLLLLCFSFFYILSLSASSSYEALWIPRTFVDHVFCVFSDFPWTKWHKLNTGFTTLYSVYLWERYLTFKVRVSKAVN